jgi:hypothetical protein
MNLGCRHTLQTAHRAIQERMAKPIFRMQGYDDSDDEVSGKSLNDLGFLFRAPLAVIAAVPLLSGMWLFMAQVIYMLLLSNFV